MIQKIRSLHLSAPGKIILCGEHAVVYGKKALACSIDLRTRVNLTHTVQSSFQIYILNELVDIDEAQFEQLKTSSSVKSQFLQVIGLLLVNLDVKWNNLIGYKVEIDTELPISAGLGSSASLSVCLATLFLLVTRKINPEEINDNLELINKHAFDIEKIFHGKPSGIDNTVVTYGGYILYQNGVIIDKFKTSLDLNVVIINSGLPKQTIEQVRKVRELHDKYPQIIESAMNSIDSLVDRFINSLKSNEELKTIKELVRINQGLLEAIQISNCKFNEIKIICEKNDYACKITGAGGGGCCFALVLDTHKLEELFKNLDENGFSYFQTSLSSHGIKLDKIEFL